MNTANPNRTQLNEGDVICVNYMEFMSGSVIDERTTEGGEPLYALTGLTRSRMRALEAILEAAWVSPSYTRLMDDAEVLLTMLREQVSSIHKEYACMHYDDGCRCLCPYCS